ncbi:MAG: carbohydrate porin [Ignavibacteriaceae bacterium]
MSGHTVNYMDLSHKTIETIIKKYCSINNMRNPILILFITFLLIFEFTKKIRAQSDTNSNNQVSPDTLNSDLDGGILNYSIENGINLKFSFTNDLLYDVSGGINTGSTYAGLFTPQLDIDLNKMIGLHEADMHISVNGTLGGNFNKKAGTEQGIDNITAFNTWKIYEFWVQKELFNNHLSFKLGLYDLNSEFDVRQSSLVFLNPSQAIGPEFSLTGKNGPSIYPTTTLAFRIKYTGNSGFYFQSAILDGVPGDPEDPYGTHIIINSKNGFLVTGEAGLVKEEGNLNKDHEKFFLGGWYYTSKFEKLLNTAVPGYPVYQEGNYGIYISGEKFLWSETENPDEGFSAFFRIGISSKEVNTVDGYLGFGVNYIGLIPGREMDELGIAIGAAHNSSKYIAKAKLENINLDKYETTIELTYLFQLTNWIKLQPDFQYVINPVHSYINDYSLISAIRLSISL